MASTSFEEHMLCGVVVENIDGIDRSPLKAANVRAAIATPVKTAKPCWLGVMMASAALPGVLAIPFELISEGFCLPLLDREAGTSCDPSLVENPI
jgi:hypothetical protein